MTTEFQRSLMISEVARQYRGNVNKLATLYVEALEDKQHVNEDQHSILRMEATIGWAHTLSQQVPAKYKGEDLWDEFLSEVAGELADDTTPFDLVALFVDYRRNNVYVAPLPPAVDGEDRVAGGVCA